jgi:hypothetical protein
MGRAVDKLLDYVSSDDAYTVPFCEVRDLQLAAINERFQERVGSIKLVALRAREAGITEIRRLEDVIPLLLPHTAYKSYPESVLIEQRWDRLTKWLGTVTTYPVGDVNLEGVADIDDWIERLARAGHPIGCSSGTTGKSAMLVASRKDIEWVCKDSVVAVGWGSNVKPTQDRQVFSLAAVIRTVRNEAIGDALRDAYGVAGKDRFHYPAPPITVGSIARMVALRKAMADGTARPAEITEYETTAAARQKAMDDAVGICADALIVARAESIFIIGLWAGLYRVAEEVRNRGYGGKDFTGDNTSYLAGGLKGAKLPDNYREYIYETFNLDPGRNFQMYGMQEIGTSMPRCQEGGRYHVPPWLVCLPLNKAGDELLPIGEGEIEGRAAFFDLSLDGRWGGVISGDRIRVDFGPCKCGAHTPSIRDDVVRYSDLEGDDKISCAGTVDAYVRGLS